MKQHKSRKEKFLINSIFPTSAQLNLLKLFYFAFCRRFGFSSILLSFIFLLFNRRPQRPRGVNIANSDVSRVKKVLSAIDGLASFCAAKAFELQKGFSARKVKSFCFCLIASSVFASQSVQSTVVIVEKAAIIVNIILRALKLENGKII